MHFLRPASTLLLGFHSIFIAALPSPNLTIGSEIQAAVVERKATAASQRLQARHSRYLNTRSRKYAVDGTAIPEVNFDVGESYAGLMPISNAANETRQFFFWFFPANNPEGSTDLTIWLNGGPGCSSLAGLIQENGPFLWQPGTKKPIRNPNSWHSLTNMLWVEQPIGTGYTEGVPDIHDEIELSQEFAGFYKQFARTFSLQDYDIYITGESYAGFYVPYIADAFINKNDTCYFNVKGISINDAFIGDTTNQQVVPMFPYATYWNDILNINAAYLDHVEQTNLNCNYSSYYDRHLQFPPSPGPFPNLPLPVYEDEGCNVFEDLTLAASASNPCFDAYRISTTCPKLWSVVGDLTVLAEPSPPGTLYFDRQDVKAAIHAPLNKTWVACTGILETFVNGIDESLAPALNGVLQRVIEYTNNTIIGSGELDMLLPTNGTLLVLQNMTWNGMQGFQQYPGQDFIVPFSSVSNVTSRGSVGRWGVERGLTFYQVQQAGHQLYAPSAAYRMLQYMLGKTPSLGE